MSSSAGDEGLVAGDALGQPRVPVHGRVGQLLGDEAALGADRHDDGVLHHLRLDQAEDLGTEVLTPVGPAQTAARDLAEAQVHALDARRVHPDLVRRARRRQVGDGLRVELHGDVRRAACRRAASWKKLVRSVALMTVRKDRRIRSSSRLATWSSARVQLLQQRVGQLAARALAVRRHPRLEEGDQQPGGVDVVAEGVLHVVLAEGRARLAQVLGVRAQHHRLPPGQPGAQHQGVEAVVLGLAGPDRRRRRPGTARGRRRRGSRRCRCATRACAGRSRRSRRALRSRQRSSYGRSSTTSTPSRLRTGSTAERETGSPVR